MMLYENDNANDRKGNAFKIKILTIFFPFWWKNKQGKNKQTHKQNRLSRSL